MNSSATDDILFSPFKEEPKPVQLIMEECRELHEEALLKRATRSLMEDRLSSPSNWRERIILKAWKEYNKSYIGQREEGFVSYLLSHEMKGFTEQERDLVALGFSTAFQWLGTNVGYNFLTELIEKQGGNIKEKSIEDILLETKRGYFDIKQLEYLRQRLEAKFNIQEQIEKLSSDNEVERITARTQTRYYNQVATLINEYLESRK